jgi:subtilisin family serine protease
MNNRRLVLSLSIAGLALLSGSGFRQVEAQAPGNGPGYVPNEVIVKYRVGAPEADKTRARGRVNGRALDNLARTPAAAAAGALELVQLPGGLTVRDAIVDLLGDPAVEYAEPNWIYTYGTDAQNCQTGWSGVGDCTIDPSADQLWGLHNTGQAIDVNSGGTVDADIDAPEAWAHGTGSASVYVGVIDEGIDFNHPDLGAQPNGQIWTNPFDPVDGSDNDGNGYVDDIHGWDFAGNNNSIYDPKGKNDATTDSHGTHVSGTIGAKANNGIGVAGVNWQVTIISAKFLGARGGTTANAIKAVDYLTDLKTRHGLNIVASNNSWGGGGFSQGLLDAIVRGAKQNILFIAAAGNGGADSVGDNNDAVASYPSNYNTVPGAGYDAVIAVAATGRFDDLRTFSNFGLNTVDLGAPGSLILSTTPKNTYNYFAGTSMATPHVTGVAALLKAARPTLTAAQLRSVILNGVDPVASLQGKTVTGGRLNAHTSMTVAP